MPVVSCLGSFSFTLHSSVFVGGAISKCLNFDPREKTERLRDVRRKVAKGSETRAFRGILSPGIRCVCVCVSQLFLLIALWK